MWINIDYQVMHSHNLVLLKNEYFEGFQINHHSIVVIISVIRIIVIIFLVALIKTKITLKVTTRVSIRLLPQPSPPPPLGFSNLVLCHLLYISLFFFRFGHSLLPTYIERWSKTHR